MSKFGYMQKGDVNAAVTKEYTIVEIVVNGLSPVLTVKPSTEANKRYTNAMLASQSGKRRSKKITVDVIKEIEAMDQKLYPLHVIAGWKDVFDGEGKPVQFTLEDCQDLINNLPSHVFARLRGFCSDIDTWAEDVDIEVAVKK